MAADIQHKQTHVAPPGLGYNDAGELVPIAPPDEEAEGTDDRRSDSPRAFLNLIELLTTNATALQAGQRAHLIAFLMGVSPCRTQTELARELNVSPGRVSQILRELPGELSAILQLKSRTAKARGIGRGTCKTNQAGNERKGRQSYE